MPSRMARYSGSERPACRMNQTGVWSTGSPRQACRKALSARVTVVRLCQARVRATVGRSVESPRDRRHAYDHRVGVRSEIDRTPPAFTAAVEQVRPRRPAPRGRGRHHARAPAHRPVRPRRQRRRRSVRRARRRDRHRPVHPAARPGRQRRLGRHVPLRHVRPRRRRARHGRRPVPAHASAGAGSPTPSTPTAATTPRPAAASPSCTPKASARWPPTAPTRRSRCAPRGRPRRDMGAHVSAWSDLLCAIAGLPPLAPGVIPLAAAPAW